MAAVPPRYSRGVAQFAKMGFPDRELCRQALEMCDGDLEQATTLLFEWSSAGPSSFDAAAATTGGRGDDAAVGADHVTGEPSVLLEELPLGAGGQVLQVRHGDLTLEQVGAIVNTANSQLMHGAGLAAAIVARGGRSIVEESRARIKALPCAADGSAGRLEVGEVATTGAGALACRHVIHAVGPTWSADLNPTQRDAKERGLRTAVASALAEAERLELGGSVCAAVCFAGIH
eukprot:COSAG01_NODE_1615_length_9724_cov_156.868725_13_plen_232_part_00